MIQLAEIYRMLNAMAMVGTVTAVDPALGCRVSKGEIETAWLKVPGLIRRNWRGASPVRVGTQVLLLSPSGDLANAVIVQILNTAALPAASNDPELDVIQWEDGTRASYHSGQQLLEVETPGRLHIKVTGDITIETDGQVTVKAGNSITLDAGADMVLKAAGAIRIGAGGMLYLDGSAIHALEGG